MVKCSQAAGTAETSRRGFSEGGSLLGSLGGGRLLKLQSYNVDFSNNSRRKHICFLTRCKYLSCYICCCFMLSSFLVLVSHMNIKMKHFFPSHHTRKNVSQLSETVYCAEILIFTLLFTGSLFQCLLHSDLSVSGTKYYLVITRLGSLQVSHLSHYILMYLDHSTILLSL